jgi:hypothetical protein
MKSLIEQMQILLPWNDDVKFENFITEYFNDLEDRYSIAEDCSVVTQNFQISSVISILEIVGRGLIYPISNFFWFGTSLNSLSCSLQLRMNGQ